MANGDGVSIEAQRRIQNSCITGDKHDYKALYYELIMEVASRWPNESRHDTAKRYIREHETPCAGCRGDSDEHICHTQVGQAI